MEVTQKELTQQAAQAIKESNYAIALTGAGLSTESGIRDYRGKNGIWTTDPEAEKRAYQQFEEFQKDPALYWKRITENRRKGGDFSQYSPSRGHLALAHLEELGLLKAVITQNIDNLHTVAGSKEVFEYHGNYRKFRCLECGTRAEWEEYDMNALYDNDALPPLCKNCNSPIKSDVVLFLEPIPRDTAEKSRKEALKSDLLLICGTSATVNPAANLPGFAKRKNKAKIIEININPTRLTEEGITDLFIQGSVGEILEQIVEEVKK